MRLCHSGPHSNTAAGSVLGTLARTVFQDGLPPSRWLALRAASFTGAASLSARPPSNMASVFSPRVPGRWDSVSFPWESSQPPGCARHTVGVHQCLIPDGVVFPFEVLSASAHCLPITSGGLAAPPWKGSISGQRCCPLLK